MKSFSEVITSMVKSFVKKSVINELYAFLFLVISTGFSLATLYVDVLKSI